MELTNWLEKRVRLSGEKTALVFQNKSETFNEVYQVVRQYADRLYAIGIRKEDYVALIGKNDRATFMLIHALQQLGAVTVFLNNRLTARELAYQIKQSDSKYVLAADEFAEKITVPFLYRFSELQAEQAAELVAVFEMERPASIMYTSGTTGNPKGVIQTYENHFWSAMASALNLGISDSDSWLCTVPIFHISGLSILMRSVIYGIPVYLEEKFDERRINELLVHGEITTISVVTTMLQRLLAIRSEAYSSRLRTVLLGGGAVSDTLLKACAKYDIPLIQSYGMTETASQIVTLSKEDAARKRGSSGKALFPSEVKIAADGEILLKGPSIMAGYLNNRAATEAAFTDGWFKTGDIGFLDEEGFLYIQERRSDLIISGGENIYPTEIEHILSAHPSIQEIAVVGKPDEQWGHVPVAFIVGDETAEVAIKQFAETELASYKVPKAFYFIKTMPRTASNKVQRHRLIESMHKKS